MSKSDDGVSESQEIAFDEDLFEINSNNNQEGEFDEINFSSEQDQRKKKQIYSQTLMQNQINLYAKSQEQQQNDQIDINRQNQNLDGNEGDIISFRDGIIVSLDSQQEAGFSNNQKIKSSSQTNSQKMYNQNFVDSEFNDEQSMGMLNIFQKNHIQEQKQQSAKKSDGGSQFNGSQDDFDQDKQQINSSIFNDQKNNNYNFDQNDQNNILNYSLMNNQNTFQVKDTLSQPLSIQNQYYDQSYEDKQDNIHQKSFHNINNQNNNNDHISESSNLLDVPVFENEKNELQINEDFVQEQSVQIEQNQIQQEQDNQLNTQQNQNFVQIEQAINEEDDDGDADIDLLKNIADNYTNSQKQKEESVQEKNELPQETNFEENNQSQKINKPIQEDFQNNQEINTLNKDYPQQEIEKLNEQNQYNDQNISQEEKNIISQNNLVFNNQRNENSSLQQQQFLEGEQNDKFDRQNEKLYQSQNQVDNNQMDIETENIQQEGKRDFENTSNPQDEIIQQKQQEGRIENSTESKKIDQNVYDDSEKKQVVIQKIQIEQKQMNNGNASTIESDQSNQIEEEKNIQKQKENEKSISEAPQTIASILLQLSQVFQNMIIPQSMVNMSLHDKQNEQTQFKTSANMQEQMNQLQNQVTSIQNSVLQIPHHLSEVSQLLCKVATTSITETVAPQNIAKSSVIIQKSTQPPAKEQETKTITQKKKEESKKPTKVSEIPKKKEETSEESEEEDESNEESEEESEEEDESDEEDLSDLKKITSKFSKGSSFGKDSISKGSQQSIGSTLNKKTSYFQPKNSFTAPKIITPSKGITTGFNTPKNETPQLSQADSITINAASIGFKEPKLFINDSDRIHKTEDLEIEDDKLMPLYEYLNKLDQPSSFLIIKEQFPDLTDEQIHTIIDEFRSEEKIGIVQLFLPKYAKCNSARIDYYYVDMIIPPPKPKKVEMEITEEQKENNGEKIELKIENIGDRKKFESMTDEQLLSYQKELNLKKQSLLDKKQYSNPTSDRIKKIQQWNEMKEVCSTVFERIAVLKGKRIQEICEDFGVKLDE